MGDTQALQRYDVVDAFVERIADFREGKGLGNLEEIRIGFNAELTKFRKQCESLQFHPNELEYIVYSIVAGIDEAALSNGGEVAMIWMRSTVQFELYGTNVAGNEFYEKLNQILEEPEKYRYALYVAYRVMASGFTGKYFNDSDGREALIDTCARLLVRLHSEFIVHKEIVKTVKKRTSTAVSGWVFVAGLVLFMILTWAVNSWRLSQGVKSSIVNHSQQMSSQKEGGR